MSVMLNCDEIRALLPHRYPFLLIDRVLDYTPGVSARAIKCVSQNEPFFTGHFPQRPIMPGVLIIEALAQTGGIALMAEEENQGRLAMLGGVQRAKFLRPVTPGDVLELSCVITRRRGPVGIGEGVAKVGDTVVCKAEILFAIQD